eukprot:7360401-Pyramimonas_sp.AAC.1
MPAADLVLSPTLVQPISHRIWGHALASLSGSREAHEALHSALGSFFSRLISRRAPPQTAPPRGGATPSGLPRRGLWSTRIRRMRALKAARASATGARASD